MSLRPPFVCVSLRLPCSDCSQLAPQPPHLPPVSCLRAAPCWQKWRVHHLLRPGGGHGHLHLRTHVPVQRLRAEAEEADQRVLPHMPEAHQGRDQDVSPVREVHLYLPVTLLRPGRTSVLTPTGVKPLSNIVVPLYPSFQMEQRNLETEWTLQTQNYDEVYFENQAPYMYFGTKISDKHKLLNFLKMNQTNVFNPTSIC